MDNRKVLVHDSGSVRVATTVPLYTVRLSVGAKTPENVEIAKTIRHDLSKEYPYFDVTKRTTKFNIYIQFRLASNGCEGLIKAAEISMRFQELLTQYTVRYGTDQDYNT